MSDFSGVPILPLTGYGAGWVLVGICVIAVLRGALVPRRTYDDKVREGEIKDKTIAELLVQIGHMREVGVTVDKIMRSIDNNARSRDQTSRGERL